MNKNQIKDFVFASYRVEFKKTALKKKNGKSDQVGPGSHVTTIDGSIQIPDTKCLNGLVIDRLGRTLVASTRTRVPS